MGAFNPNFNFWFDSISTITTSLFNCYDLLVIQPQFRVKSMYKKMLTCTPQYDNKVTIGLAHGTDKAHRTWLIVNTTFTDSYYEDLHID